MTLNELIEELQGMVEGQPDLGNEQVVMSADYGDICHTMQALDIHRVEAAELYESAYSKSGLAVIDPNEEDSMKVAGTAIVLR